MKLKRRITRNTGTGTYHNNVKRKTLYVYFLYNGTHIIIIHKNVEEEGTYYVYISLGEGSTLEPGLVQYSTPLNHNHKSREIPNLKS